MKQAMREELLRRLQNDNNTGDGGTEMDPVIKQILPIPESLTCTFIESLDMCNEWIEASPEAEESTSAKKKAYDRNE